MKRFLLFVIVLLSFSLLSSIPYTCQGVLNVPKAYVLPSGMFDIAYTMYGVNDKDGFNDDDFHFLHAGILNVGLFDLGEIGIVALSEDVYYGNFKIKILHEKLEIPALAFGMENVFSKFDQKGSNLFEENLPDRNDYIKNSPYLAASKSGLILTDIAGLSKIELLLSVGIGWRKFHGKGSIVKHAVGRFGSLDVRFSDRFGITAQYDAHNINLGLSYLYKNLQVSAGIIELEDYWAVKHEHFYKIGLNLKYTFDFLSDVKINKYNEYHFTDYPYAEPTDYLYETYPELPYTDRHEKELEELKDHYHE